MSLVYINGDYLPIEEANVSVLDRGFTFGDGVYEVIPVFSNTIFRLEEHMQRLNYSLQAIFMENPLSTEQWSSIFKRLITTVSTSDQSIYLQITRGVTERDHDISLAGSATVFVMSKPIHRKNIVGGIKAITHEDIRWSYCHIKAITLLPSVLLRHIAKQQGAKEAILIRHGYVTEGAASNVFLVKDRVVYTSPKDNKVLPGITRNLVLEILGNNNIEFKEQRIAKHMLMSANEIWITSSTWEIIPVTQLDEIIVGNGNPGPVWQQLRQLYQEYKRRYCQ